MPNWLVVLLTLILMVALGVGTWTWYQAFLNWQAVRGDEALVGFARNHLQRLTALWIALAGLTTIGVVSFIPRTTFSRLVTSVSTAMLAIALAGVSYHEYRTMKDEVVG